MTDSAQMTENVFAPEDRVVDTEEKVFDNIKGTRDALTVKRVFGDAYQVGELTIIPVARVAGGAGGGGGEGSDGDDGTGRGFGSGFGMGATPVGVYEVRDGEVTWKPAVDANNAVRGGQVLAGLVIACITFLLARRRT